MIQEIEKAALYPDPLPENWRLTAIGDLASKMTNGFVGTVTPHQVQSDGIVYIQSYNVRENRIDLANVTYVTPEFSNSQAKSILREGDLLTVQSGHVGTSAVVPKELSGVNCHALIITRFNDEAINPQFVAQYLNSYLGKRRLRGLRVGSSLAHINTKDLRQFLIPVPPRSEQDRIVVMADLWDRTIEHTARLIAAKQERKRGLMQQLFAGRRRFSAFQKPWSSATFGQVFSTKHSRNSGSRIRTPITVGKYAIRPQSEHFNRVVASDNLENYNIIEYGDFVYDPMSAYYGAFGRYELEEPGIVSPVYRVLRINPGYDSDFMKHLIKSHRIAYQLSANSSQGNRQGKRRTIQEEAFDSISFAMPDIDEQQAIAQVLAACDHEVDLLTQKLGLLKQQKQGLMQQLLTGKVRVSA